MRALRAASIRGPVVPGRSVPPSSLRVAAHHPPPWTVAALSSAAIAATFAVVCVLLYNQFLKPLLREPSATRGTGLLKLEAGLMPEASPDTGLRFTTTMTLSEGEGREFFQPVLAFSGSGRILAATTGAAGGVGVWDMADGRRLFERKKSGNRISSLGFAKDDTSLAIVYSGPQPGVELFDIWKGERMASVSLRRAPDAMEPLTRDHMRIALDGEVTDLIRHQGGRYASIRSVTLLERGMFPPNRCLFSPDGQRIACSKGPDVLVWNTQTGDRISVLSAGEGVRVLAFRADGRYLATETRGRVAVWNVEWSRPAREFPGEFHGGAAAFHPDGKALALCRGGEVLLWDLTAGRILDRAIFPDHLFRLAAFSPAQDAMALASEDQIRICRVLKSGKEQSGTPQRRGP